MGLIYCLWCWCDFFLWIFTCEDFSVIWTFIPHTVLLCFSFLEVIPSESQSTPCSFYPAGLSQSKYSLLCASEVWRTKGTLSRLLLSSRGGWKLSRKWAPQLALSKVWFTALSIKKTPAQPHSWHLLNTDSYISLFHLSFTRIWHSKGAGLRSIVIFPQLLTKLEILHVDRSTCVCVTEAETLIHLLLMIRKPPDHLVQEALKLWYVGSKGLRGCIHGNLQQWLIQGSIRSLKNYKNLQCQLICWINITFQHFFRFNDPVFKTYPLHKTDSFFTHLFMAFFAFWGPLFFLLHDGRRVKFLIQDEGGRKQHSALCLQEIWGRSLVSSCSRSWCNNR